MTAKPREKSPDSDEDPVENMLKKTGCLEQHYKIQAILQNAITTPMNKNTDKIRPWITPELMQCIRNRNKLYKQTKRFPGDATVLQTYKTYKHFCNSLIWKQKDSYMQSITECIAETKDWRKCQTQVNDFRDCINKHKKEADARN